MLLEEEQIIATSQGKKSTRGKWKLKEYAVELNEKILKK